MVNLADFLFSPVLQIVYRVFIEWSIFGFLTNPRQVFWADEKKLGACIESDALFKHPQNGGFKTVSISVRPNRFKLPYEPFPTISLIQLETRYTSIHSFYSTQEIVGEIPYNYCLVFFPTFLGILCF